MIRNLSKKYKPKDGPACHGDLKRIIHHGQKHGYNGPTPLLLIRSEWTTRPPKVLSSERLKNLLKAIDASEDIQAADMMPLYTGMRRGEMFKLLWSDVDFERGFINIRDPKGGVSQKIPLNEQAREVLENHPETADHVFTRDDGKPFNDIHKRVNAIKAAAGIKHHFRALHGLRHVYASMLASSGQVDMYTLQKLLTHKSPVMTQRYAHLHDEALRRAFGPCRDIIKNATSQAGPGGGGSQ